MYTDRINEPQYNAGNFQEYNYECEWIENSYNIMCGCIDLVTAFTYPWIQYENSFNRQ